MVWDQIVHADYPDVDCRHQRDVPAGAQRRGRGAGAVAHRGAAGARAAAERRDEGRAPAAAGRVADRDERPADSDQPGGAVAGRAAAERRAEALRRGHVHEFPGGAGAARSGAGVEQRAVGGAGVREGGDRVRDAAGGGAGGAAARRQRVGDRDGVGRQPEQRVATLQTATSGTPTIR